MKAEICFDMSFDPVTNGSVKLEYLPEVNSMHLQWYGVLSYDDHKRAAEQTYDWIRKTGATRWIGDVTRLTAPMSEGIADYIGWQWFPGAMAAGISEKVAVVKPRLDFILPSTMMIAQRIMEMHGEAIKSMKIEAFDCMYKAREWMGKP